MNEWQDVRRAESSRFVSLKWKVGLVISLVLIVVNSLITLAAYQQSNQQFNQQKLDLLLQQQKLISGLLERDYQQLTSFAGFIPLLNNRVARPSPGTSALSGILDRHSALLSLEWGITAVSFFNAQGVPVTVWPAGQSNDRHARLAADAARRDAPAGRVECERDCVLTLAVPQLEGELRGGVLVLSRTVAEGILEFNRLTGSEVAVLVNRPPPAPGEPQVDGRYLDAWSSAVPALSHPQLSLRVLDKLQTKGSLSQLERETMFVELDGEWFACLAGHDSRAGEDTAFVVISPVSDDVAQLEKANRVILAAGAVGLLATGIILLAALWKPMNRIRKLALALPALGRSDFQALHDALPARRDKVLSDEIDVVVNSVASLSDDLERALEARTEAEQNLVWLADHDPLTNLYNRRRFQEVFERILSLSVRYKHSGALLFFDLDQFKYVNDLSGHQAGDALLLLVASTLRDAVRHSDVLARLGGDEFALVLPESSAEDAVYIANKLQHDLSQIDFSSSGRVHKINCSVGITMFPSHGRDIHELLANADMAMYQAKEAGGARWHMYSPDEQAKELLAKRARWRDRITRALLEEAFELHFQPIFDIKAQCVTRFETLVRMRDNQGELVFPDNFIPVAEQSGQIHEIDRWVIRRVIDRIRSMPGVALAVNLSGRVLDDPSLLEWFHDQLKSSRIDPSRLIVEITETAAVANVQDAIAFMREIKALGCRFALDDFGSGFSSFAYLKQLPVDIVKIDGAFIQHLATSSEDQLFVKALTDVAQGLGKETVAEFVEDAATLELLKAFGVDYAQGYHIGMPQAKMTTRR